jgi:hypothetical protein
MGFDPLSIGLMLAGTAAETSAQLSAAKAQEAAGKYEADLLTTQAENDTESRIENTRRIKDDKARQLSRVKVIQASSGTLSGVGTNSLVFDDIESRLEEGVENFSRTALAHIGRTENAAKMALWRGESNAAGTRLQAAGSLFKGLAKAGGAGYNAGGPPS